MIGEKNEELGVMEAVDSVETKQTKEIEGSNGSDNPSITTTAPVMNKEKWLACIALCFAYTTSFQQNACTSAILKQIDEELGPTTYYNWMLTAYSICVCVSLPISGGLSDIFGRKGFVIAGCFVALIGTAISIGAQNVPMMIAAMCFKGLGSGSQQLALAAVAELVPNRHRGNAQAALDLVTLPWAVFGSLTGNAMVKYYKLSFRINFIIGAILNVISIITIWFWYHPPGATRIHGKSQLRRVSELDWFGVFLMASGIVLFLVGIALGGVQFPWKSGGTIGTIVVGALCLIGFGIWEWRFAKKPFFAHELFVDRSFPIFLVLTFVTGMALFSAAAFWTQQVQGMFVRDPVKIGLSTIPGGLGGAVGGFFGGFLMGKAKFLTSRSMLFYGVVVKIVADGLFTTVTPSSFHAAMGYGFLAMFGIGFMMVGLIVCTQLVCADRNIGLATLVLGSVRAMGGSVAVTLYTAIIQDTLKKDGPLRVAKKVIPLGVPIQSLPKLVVLVIGGQDTVAAKLPGLTPELVQSTREVLKFSWALAYQRMYYGALAFTAVAVIATLFVKDVTHNMTDNVAVILQNDTSATEKKKDVV